MSRRIWSETTCDVCGDSMVLDTNVTPAGLQVEGLVERGWTSIEGSARRIDVCPRCPGKSPERRKRHAALLGSR